MEWQYIRNELPIRKATYVFEDIHGKLHLGVYKPAEYSNSPIFYETGKGHGEEFSLEEIIRYVEIVK